MNDETDDATLLERFGERMAGIEAEIPAAPRWSRPPSAARPGVRAHTRAGGLAPALASAAVLVVLVVGASLLPATVPPSPGPSGSPAASAPAVPDTTRVLSATDLGVLLRSSGATPGRVVIAAGLVFLPANQGVCRDPGGCSTGYTVDGLPPDVIVWLPTARHEFGSDTLLAVRISSPTSIDLLGTVTPGPAGLAWTVDEARQGGWSQSIAVIDGWLDARNTPIPCPSVPGTPNPAMAGYGCGHDEWIAAQAAPPDLDGASVELMRVANGSYRAFASDPALADAARATPEHGLWVVGAAGHFCSALDPRLQACSWFTVLGRLDVPAPIVASPTPRPSNPAPTSPSPSAQLTGDATLHLEIEMSRRPEPSGVITTGLEPVANLVWARLTGADGRVAARWQPGVDPDPTVPAGTYELEAWPVYRDDWVEGGTSWRDGGDRPMTLVTLQPGSSAYLLQVTGGWTRPWSLGGLTLVPAPEVVPSPISAMMHGPDTITALAIDALHAEERLAGRIAAPIAVRSLEEMSSASAVRAIPQLEALGLAARQARVWLVLADGTFATGAAATSSGYLVFDDDSGVLLAIGPTGGAPLAPPRVSLTPFAMRLGGAMSTIRGAFDCASKGWSAWYVRFCAALASDADWRSIHPTVSNPTGADPDLAARVVAAYLSGDRAVCEDPQARLLELPIGPGPNTAESFRAACTQAIDAIEAAGYATVKDPGSSDAPALVIQPAGGTPAAVPPESAGSPVP